MKKYIPNCAPISLPLRNFRLSADYSHGHQIIHEKDIDPWIMTVSMTSNQRLGARSWKSNIYQCAMGIITSTSKSPYARKKGVLFTSHNRPALDGAHIDSSLALTLSLKHPPIILQTLHFPLKTALKRHLNLF